MSGLHGFGAKMEAIQPLPCFVLGLRPPPLDG